MSEATIPRVNERGDQDNRPAKPNLVQRVGSFLDAPVLSTKIDQNSYKELIEKLNLQDSLKSVETMLNDLNNFRNIPNNKLELDKFSLLDFIDEKIKNIKSRFSEDNNSFYQVIGLIDLKNEGKTIDDLTENTSDDRLEKIRTHLINRGIKRLNFICEDIKVKISKKIEDRTNLIIKEIENAIKSDPQRDKSYVYKIDFNRQNDNFSIQFDLKSIKRSEEIRKTDYSQSSFNIDIIVATVWIKIIDDMSGPKQAQKINENINKVAQYMVLSELINEI